MKDQRFMQAIKAYFKRHGHDPFKLGQGRISGYLSAALGLLSLLAVLCFLFPQWLTFAEFRKSTACTLPVPRC